MSFALEFLHSPLTKLYTTFGITLTTTSAGIYTYGLSSLIYPSLLILMQHDVFPLLINSLLTTAGVINKLNILNMTLSLDKDELSINASDRELLEKLKYKVINSNDKFKGLEKIIMYTTNESSGPGIITSDKIGIISIDKSSINFFSEGNDYSMLEAVISHELGHAAENHKLSKVTNEYLSTLSLATIYNLFNPYAKVLLGGMLAPTAELILSKIASSIKDLSSSYISRQHEYRADYASVESGLGKAMMKALLKIRKESTSHNDKADYLSSFYSSHPSTENRLYHIIRAEKALNDEQNKESPSFFQQLLQPLVDIFIEQCLESSSCTGILSYHDKDFISYASEYADS